VRVPSDIELGNATITVRVPDWKERVRPLTVEVPVLAREPAPTKAGL